MINHCILFRLIPVCCYLLVVLFVSPAAFAQSQLHLEKIKSQIDQTFDPFEAKSQMEYLASDAMQGRDTGTPELKEAARYLVKQMKNVGVQPVPGADSGYYQEVPLQQKQPVKSVALKINGHSISSDQIAVINGADTTLKGTAKWINENDSEISIADLNNRIILFGPKDAKRNTNTHSMEEWFRISRKQYVRAAYNGAKAVIHLVTGSTKEQWARFRQQVMQPGMSLADNNRDTPAIPYIIIFDGAADVSNSLAPTNNPTIFLQVSGGQQQRFSSNNVVGMVEGTSKEFKDEYILLTAHYDHIGIKSGVTAGQDSINNGARDNGIGMVALLQAANHIAAHPLKRSVLFLFVTAEEKGLLGSKWYVDQPLIDLKNTVFNLNIDGAGYNDTSKVVIVGLEKTSARNHFIAAVEAYHLTATASPVPQLNLFYRSDNIWFARKGIPAPTFTQGFTGFDAELQKYYHKPADEVESLNYPYLNKYYKSFILALNLIGNDEKRPEWLPGAGEEFIEAYQLLYL